MIGYDLPFILGISVLLLVPGILIFIKEKPSKWYWLFLAIGLIYINCMVDKLFFPIFVDNNEAEFAISNYMNVEVSFGNMDTMQLILNILVTVPLGLALTFMYRRKFVVTAIMTVLLSVAIEGIQLLIICIAKPANIWFDLTDVILNTCGGIIGVVILFILQKICIKNKGRGIGVIKYVIDTMELSR